MKKKILVTIAGDSDLRCLNSYRFHVLGVKEPLTAVTNSEIKREPIPYIGTYGTTGPSRTFVESSQFKEIEKIYVLFTSKFAPLKQELTDWINTEVKTEIVPVCLDIPNPSDYPGVYTEFDRFFSNYWSATDADRFCFCITGGTPVIHSVFFYLTQVKYTGGDIFQVSRPEYASSSSEQLIKTSLPFKFPPPVRADECRGILPSNTEEYEMLMNTIAKHRMVNILLTGAPGVGKSHLAHEIHEKFDCRDAPFVEINCSEISNDVNTFVTALFGYEKGAYTGAIGSKQGAFRDAVGGTIFLDEIGDIPLHLQTTLLTALQERSVLPLGSRGNKRIRINDVRVISATNHDLKKDIQQGKFRLDLYQRLAMYPYHFGSLRDTCVASKEKFFNLVADTIHDLQTQYSSDEYLQGKTYELSEQAKLVLLSHSWPGNMRELNYTLLMAMFSAYDDKVRDLNSDVIKIKPVHIEQYLIRNQESFSLDNSIDYTEFPDDLEQWLKDQKMGFIKAALERCNNNKKQAARLLNYSYDKLNNALGSRDKDMPKRAYRRKSTEEQKSEVCVS